MVKKIFVLAILFLSFAYFGYAGVEFGTYMKVGSTINGNKVTNDILLWSLNTDSPYGNFEIQANAAAAPGINFWSIFKSSVSVGYVSGGYIANSSYLADYDFASHVQFWQKWGEMVFFYNESWRINMYQPLLQFSLSVGTGNNGGIHTRLPNFLGSGFEFKFTLIDYANELLEKSAQEPKNETALTFRFSRYDIKEPLLDGTLGVGVTGGFELYQLPRNTNDYDYYVSNSWEKGQYNVLGLDLSYSGSLKWVPGLSYSLMGEVGRSFAPENVPNVVPDGWTKDDWMFHRFVLGDVDSLVYKISAKISYDQPKTIGGIEITYSVVSLQTNFYQYLGGAADPASGRQRDYFEQFIQLSYAFPVKFVNLKSYMKYTHNYDFPAWVDSDGVRHDDYNIWQFLLQEKMASKNSSHYLEWISELYAVFKGGVKGIITFEQYFGRDYLLQVGPTNWFRHLSFALDFENEFAKLKPMAKIFNLQEPEKTFVGFGIESTVNITSWLKFYTRLGVMRGYYERVSGSGNISWSSFYGELQVYPAANTRVVLRYGNDVDMDRGVGDNDFVGGAETQNLIKIEAEMYF
jgi:hypothetical protein